MVLDTNALEIHITQRRFSRVTAELMTKTAIESSWPVTCRCQKRHDYIANRSGDAVSFASTEYNAVSSLPLKWAVGVAIGKNGCSHIRWIGLETVNDFVWHLISQDRALRSRHFKAFSEILRSQVSDVGAPEHARATAAKHHQSCCRVL
jgi:hypothetical protein